MMIYAAHVFRKGFYCINQNLTLYHRMTLILSVDWILWANVENLMSDSPKKYIFKKLFLFVKVSVFHSKKGEEKNSAYKSI